MSIFNFNKLTLVGFDLYQCLIDSTIIISLFSPYAHLIEHLHWNWMILSWKKS